MDIRVYDFDFNLLCIMSDVISSSWSIKYNAIGTYEGHFKLNDRISDIILSSEYLIITEGKNQAVCTGKIADDELLVCGRTINWLLSKRVIPPFKTRDIFGEEYTDTASVINYVLQRTFLAPPKIGDDGLYIEESLDEKKAVENFVLVSAGKSEKLDRHFWRTGANTAEDVIKDLADITGAGHRLSFNVKEKTWDFEIIYGVQRDFIISDRTRNFSGVTYTEDIENYACGGWYEELPSADDESTDGAAVWKYIEKETQNSGMKYWEAVLGGTGNSEAQSSLSSKQLEFKVQGTVQNLKYMKDYNLGDSIKVRVTFGSFRKEFIYKITGVNIWHNSQGAGEEPVFTKIQEV